MPMLLSCIVSGLKPRQLEALKCLYHWKCGEVKLYYWACGTTGGLSLPDWGISRTIM